MVVEMLCLPENMTKSIKPYKNDKGRVRYFLVGFSIG